MNQFYVKALAFKFCFTICVAAAILTPRVAFSQCGWFAANPYSPVGEPPCGWSSQIPIGSGEFVYFSSVAGQSYSFSTCGSAFDTQVSVYYLTGGVWTPWPAGGYVDDNGPDCAGTQASITTTAPATTTNNIVVVNQYNCSNYVSSTSAVLKYRRNDATAPSTPSAPTTSWSGDHYVCGNFNMVAPTNSTDLSGPVTYRLCRSNNNAGGCSVWVAAAVSAGATVTVSGTNLPGANTYRYYYWYAYDVCGNQSAASAGTYVRMDGTAPTTPNAPTTSWSGDQYVCGNFNMVAPTNSTDGGVGGITYYRLCRSNNNASGCAVWVAPAVAAGATVTVSGTNLPGANTYRYYYWYAYDTCGNQSGASTGTYVRMDGTAPVYNSVSVTGADCQIGNTYYVKNGTTFYVNINHSDNAGTSTQYLEFTYNNTSPGNWSLPNIKSYANPYGVANGASYNSFVDGPQDNTQLDIQNSQCQTAPNCNTTALGRWPVVAGSGTSTNYGITVYMYDYCGTGVGYTQTGSFLYLDNSAPSTATPTIASGGGTNSQTWSISASSDVGSGTNASGYEWRYSTTSSTGPWTTLTTTGGTTSPTISLGCGANVWVQARAKDCVGNIGSWSASGAGSDISMTTTVGVTNVSCNAGSDGVVSANVANGQPPYTYSWSPGGQTTAVVGSRGPGSYTVTVTDAAGCTTSASGTVGQPSTAVSLTSSFTNETCPGVCDGTISITPSGGTQYNSQPNSGALASNLVLWANGANGVLKDQTNNVSQWSDLSGSGNHITQSSSGNRPTWVSSAINSEPVVRFNTSQWMATATNFGTPYTIFTISKMNGGATNRLISSYSTNWLMGYHGGSVNDIYANGWVYNPSAAAGTSVNLHTVTGTGGITTLYNCATAYGGNGAGVSGPGRLRLNGWSTGLGETSNGDVAEVIMYNRVLTAAELQGVRNYLSNKYNMGCTGGNPYTYSWTGPSSYTSTQEDITGLCDGDYTVTVTDANGCSVTSPTITIGTTYTESTAHGAISGVTSICNGASTTLSINPATGVSGSGSTYQWFSSSCGGTSAGTGTSITVSPSSTTEYFVRRTGTCNTTTCSSIIVTVVSATLQPIEGDQTISCGTTTTFSSNEVSEFTVTGR